MRAILKPNPFQHPHPARSFSPAHQLMSVLVVAFLGVINPAACLLHCWLASHAGHAVAHVQPAPSHAMEPEAPTEEAASSSSRSCAPMHTTSWTLTIAVVFNLPWIGMPFQPSTLRILPSLFLRLTAVAPPLRPPRFAPFASLIKRPAIV